MCFLIVNAHSICVFHEFKKKKNSRVHKNTSNKCTCGVRCQTSVPCQQKCTYQVRFHFAHFPNSVIVSSSFYFSFPTFPISLAAFSFFLHLFKIFSFFFHISLFLLLHLPSPFYLCRFAMKGTIFGVKR